MTAPLLDLKRGLVYGPVHSRRLGASLGVNLLPATGKACSFDCAYCQYGWTRWHRPADIGRLDFPAATDVLDAVRQALAALPEPPAFLTFSGNGEPTLHPEFHALVDGVRRLRDRLAPSTRTAVLSNSATVADRATRAALARLDVRIMKLDAGSQATLERFNRPAPGVALEAIVDGLSRLGGVTLQALFAAGAGGNAKAEDVGAWLEAVRAVDPVATQVYTLARGWPARDLEPLASARLIAIRDAARARGLACEAF